MADREKLDKIKEKTGISQLDEDTRRDLFNKFVKAGGQVYDEKQKRRQMIIDRQKQRDRCGRPEAGKHADSRSDEDANQAEEQVSRGERGRETEGQGVDQFHALALERSRRERDRKQTHEQQIRGHCRP